MNFVVLDEDLCSGEQLNGKNSGSRSAQGRPASAGGILQSAKEGRMPAMRMLGNSLPVRGNRMCKDEVIFTVLELVMPQEQLPQS